jgi:hypothetical protein
MKKEGERKSTLLLTASRAADSGKNDSSRRLEKRDRNVQRSSCRLDSGIFWPLARAKAAPN